MVDSLLKGALGPAFAVALSAGCAVRPPPPPPKAAPPPPVEVDRGLPDAGWGVVESARFFVEVPLPDFRAWSVDDRQDRWLVAAHLPSKSMLWLRTWREGKVVSRADCEAAARQWRPDLFGRDSSLLVGRRPLPAPDGFDTEVGYTVVRKGDALAGIAAAAGASIRRCLAVAYVTKDEGADADRIVAERLGFVTDAVFARLKTRTIDDRVQGPRG